MDRVPEPREGKSRNIFAAKSIKHCLAVAIMLKTRRGDRELEQFTLARIGIHVHQALGLLERQTAQKEIVDQAENGSVQTNPEREREDGDEGERRRLLKLSKS